MKNEILDIPNESILDTNFKEQIEKEIQNIEVITYDSSSNIVSDNFNADEKNQLNNDIDTTTNCLALTVKENYHMVVIKNFFKKGFRVSWKVGLGIFTINFLNMFL